MIPMLKTKSIITLLILLFSFAAFAADTKTDTELELAKIQIVKLTAQVDAMNKFQTDLLTTVYWSLGTLITVAIFLIGYSWFSNFRVYERDKLSLKSELSANINSDMEHIRSEFSQKTVEFKNEVKDQVNESIRSEIDTLDRKINKYRNESKSEFLWLEKNLIEMERDKWREKKVLSNAFRASAKLLKNAILLESNWSVSAALDSLLEDLNAILKQTNPSTHLDSDDIQRAVKIIEQVDSSHALIIKTIKEKISSTTSRS